MDSNRPGDDRPDLPKPRPEPTPTTRPYWDALADDRILVPRCTACGAWIFYPRARCTTCLSDTLEWTEISGTAHLRTWSVTAQPTVPMFADEMPQIIAIVETSEGIRMTTTIVTDDPASLRADIPVAPVFDHGDDGRTLLRFRPLED